MTQSNVWFPWSVVAFLQVPVSLGWGTGSRYYIERFFRVRISKEQEQLKEAFKKYLSPQMLDKLSEDGFKMKFGGEKVEAAMIFTDLESFTNMCERVGDAERIVEALSDYFERTTTHIFEYDGGRRTLPQMQVHDLFMNLNKLWSPVKAPFEAPQRITQSATGANTCCGTA